MYMGLKCIFEFMLSFSFREDSISVLYGWELDFSKLFYYGFLLI